MGFRRSNNRMYIVADIGGTKMRIAGSRDLANLTEPVILDTPHDHDLGIALIKSTAQEIAGDEKIEGFIAGVPGVISRDRRSLFSAHHLHGWDGHNLADEFATALDTNAHIENDTALVGLGEYTYGAGVGAGSMVYMTVSTGVNSAHIVDGRIDRDIG